MKKPWFEKYSIIKKDSYITKKKILNEKWYHSYKFPDGTVINGTYNLEKYIEKYIGDIDLNGKKFLDLGCADGYVTISAINRGAIVTSLDASSFNLKHTIYACQKFNVNSTIIECDIFSDEFLEIGTFDIIFLSHVLCHIHDSLSTKEFKISKKLALDRIEKLMHNESILIVVDANKNVDYLLKEKFDVTITKGIDMLNSERYICKKRSNLK